MKGQKIICFAKDIDEAPTSNHHVMRELARDNVVVWLNSVATRTPSLRRGRDLRKIAAKLQQFAGGPRRREDGLWVFTPLVLPFPNDPRARAVNRQLLRVTVQTLRRRLDIDQFQLWTFLPGVADYIGALHPTLVVYYCVDEWSLFQRLDGPQVAAAERQLCRSADLVFGVCPALVEERRALNPCTYLAPHGVDHDLFRRALDDDPVPTDVASLARPLIGFFGTIEHWVDQQLIAELARRRQDWTFVLIGPRLVDTSALDSLANVHLLGRRDHAELPAYCRAFAVGLIPYRLEARMRYVNPLKLREYASAGLPVVSVPIPEATRHQELCTIARDADEFEAAIARAIRLDGMAARRSRSAAMRSETWSQRVADVTRLVVMKMEEKRCSRHSDVE